MKNQDQTPSNKKSAEEKLKLARESLSLSETELGAFIRKHGIYSSQLEEWVELLYALENQQRKPKGRGRPRFSKAEIEVRDLKKQERQGASKEG